MDRGKGAHFASAQWIIYLLLADVDDEGAVSPTARASGGVVRC